jgi:hypothetical protein
MGGTEMPLIVKGKGKVVLKPEPPIMSRLYVPKQPRRVIDRDTVRVQTALLMTRSSYANG